MSTAEIHTVDSSYMIKFELVSGGFRVEDLSGDTAPHTYHPPYSSYLYYHTEYGVWRRTTGNGKWEFASDKSGCGRDYRPVIDASTDPETLAQKNYREMVEEDKRKSSILMGNPILKKEVKGKMTRILYSVRIFNVKTEATDYQAELVGTDAREVEMLAAQTFGKFDPKIHIVDTDIILDFSTKDVPKE